MNRYSLKNSQRTMFKTKKKEKVIDFPIFFLSLLITASFYVVPLQRIEYFGTDFRLFDFVFAAFFILVGLQHWNKLLVVFKKQDGIFKWVLILLVMVWLSLIMTFTTGGSSKILPSIVRSLRFTAYFLTGAFVIVLVDSPQKFRWIMKVFYFNIVLQAGLAIAQKLGWIGTFYPVYYVASYGETPVGTLSAHHKQIGIVMVIGVGMSLAYLMASKDFFGKFLHIIFMGMMVAASVFAISRTGWLGLAGLALGYFLIYKGRSIGVGIFVIIGISLTLLLLQFIGIDFVNLIEQDVNMVVIDRFERFGIEGITGDRLKVYDNYPDAIVKAPWILLVGTGFQNIITFIRAAGAHNNYVQVLFELGIFGFIVYSRMLYQILRELHQAGRILSGVLESAFAKSAFSVFVGILFTMLVGESFWAQSSMRTLTAQIMIMVGLAVAPLYNWQKVEVKEDSKAIAKAKNEPLNKR